MKMGGIQHIICSATLTIDKLGRVTPRQSKIMQKKKQTLDDVESTMDHLCKMLKFRSKNPKIIDLTAQEDEQAQALAMMPETLREYLTRCKTEDKDLTLYYYLQEKQGESIIVFCNAITATRRLTSLLDFLKVPNYCLHSKM